MYIFTMIFFNDLSSSENVQILGFYDIVKKLEIFYFLNVLVEIF